MASPTTPSGHIAYIFTSFPKLTEQFLAREVHGLGDYTDLEIEIHALIGRGEARFNRFPVFRFSFRDWLALPYRLVRELLRRPGAFHRMAELNDNYLPGSWLNGLEHYLGLGYAIVRAAEFRRHPPESIHAVWATGPASAALFLHLLNDSSFSMGCHAYDIFRFGGDVLLPEKILRARFIQTSTAQAKDDLIARGAAAQKVHLIRRSAPRQLSPSRANASNIVLHQNASSQAQADSKPASRTPIRILCVGRLVEKKGYHELLTILHQCSTASIPYLAKIIGEGPLRKDLEQQIARLKLEDKVQLAGKLPYHEVEAAYRSFADVLFFTGKTASTGDRDGLPNVIIEAMTVGLPVFASSSGAAVEAIHPGLTGELFDIARPELWAAALNRLADDPQYRCRLQRGARAWVERHCNPQTNTLALAERLVS